MDATSAHSFSSDQILNQFLIIQKQLSEHETRLREWGTPLTLEDRNSLQEAIAFFDQIKEGFEFWERRYQLLLTHTSSRVLELTPQGIILNANSALCQCTGYADEELIGQTWWETLSPNEPSGTTPDLAERLQSGEPLAFTVTITGKEGQEIVLAVQAQPSFNGAGELEQLLLVGEDISERVRLEQRAQRLQHDITEIQRISHLGSWIWDIPSNTVTWSEELYRIYGLSPEEFEASFEGFLERVHPDDREQTRQIIAKALDDLTTFVFEHRIIRPDGRERHLLARGEVFRDSQGEVTRMIGTGQDITERVNSEEALRAREALLDAAVSGAPLILSMIDREGIIHLSMGKTLGDLLAGLETPSGETVGKSIYALYGDQYPQVIESFENALQGASVITTLEAENITFETRFEPLKNKHGDIEGVIGLALDITERKRTEEKLRKQTSANRLLKEIATASNEARSIQSAFKYALLKICEYTGWSIGHVYFIDRQDPDRLIPSDIWATDKKGKYAAFQQATQAANFSPEVGIIGKVFALKEPILLTDLSAAEFSRSEAALEADLTAAYVFPVFLSEEPIAVMEFYAANGFEPEDDILEIMQNVGTMLGRVIERDRAQESLRDSEERYRLLIESVQDYAIFSLDQNGRITSWNVGAEKIKGYTAEEVLGEHFSIFYLPEDRERGIPTENLEKARKFGRLEQEGWRVRKDGSQLWATVVISPLYDEDGELLGYSKVVRDLTRRRQAYQALQESEARFRTIFESAGIGIELVDLEGRLLAINPAIWDIFGYDRDELLSEAQAPMYQPVNVVAGSAHFQRLSLGEIDSYSLERPFQHKDGEQIWVQLTVSLIRDAESNPSYAVAMVNDITERRQMEAEVAELNRRLMEERENERLHLAQELHDGPVQDLYGLAFSLKSLQASVSEAEERSQVIEIDHTVQRVVDSLRSMSVELRPPSLAPFGLEKSLRTYADDFQDKHPDIKIELSLMEDGQKLPENVRLALYRIFQVSLTNVLRHAKASTVWVRFNFDAEEVVLEIQDDGVGFELPERWIDFAREGHLGLVGAFERAEAMEGELNVESSPGQGTRICVRVPRDGAAFNQ